MGRCHVLWEPDGLSGFVRSSSIWRFSCRSQMDGRARRDVETWPVGRCTFLHHLDLQADTEGSSVWCMHLLELASKSMRICPRISRRSSYESVDKAPWNGWTRPRYGREWTRTWSWHRSWNHKRPWRYQRKYARLSPPNLVDVLKYQDPLHTLLEYIAKVSLSGSVSGIPVIIECYVAIPWLWYGHRSWWRPGTFWWHCTLI